MTGTKSKVVMIIISCIGFGCANIYSEMSDKTTDKALLYEARLQLGKGNWDTALTAISSMTAEFRSSRTVQVLKASAYSGKCGLNFIDMASALQNAGANSFFTVLLGALRRGGSVTALNHCRTAETILSNIGTSITRTAEENLLMAFNSLTKMGVILNIYADANADGTVDAGFLPCNVIKATGVGAFPSNNTPTNYADNIEMVTGLSLFVTSLAAAGASSAGGSVFTSLQTACTILAGLPGLGGINPCAVTTRTDPGMTASVQAAIRSAVISSDIGLSVNDGGTCAYAACYAGACSIYP